MSESKIKKRCVLGMLFLLFFGTTRGVCAPSFGFFSEQDEQALMDAFFASRTVREVPKEAAFGAYLAGSLAKSDMDFKSAARYHHQAIEKDRENPDLINSLYALYVLSGQPEKAVPYAHRALSLGKETIFPALILFTDAFLHGEKQEALAFLDGMPADGYLIYLKALCQAWLYTADKKTEPARQKTEKLIELPATKMLHQALMEDYSGNAQKAHILFQKLVSMPEAKNAQILAFVKSFYARHPDLKPSPLFQKRYEEVFSESFVTREMLENVPRDLTPVTVQKGLALSFFDMAGFVQHFGNSETALFLSRIARWLNPQSDILAFFEAEVLESMKLLNEADSIYQKAKSGGMLYYSMKLRQAMNALAKKQPQKAVDILKKEIDKGAGFPIYYMTMGDAYRDLEQCDLAIKAYDQSLALLGDVKQPVSAPLHFSKGVCFEKMKQNEAALKSLTLAANLVPDNPVYLNYLGYLWLETNQKQQEALALIQRAVQAMPQDGNVLDSLGWAYYQLGRYEEALPMMEKAVARMAGHAEINAHLGDVYWQLGRYREARFQWNHALTLEQGNSETLKKSLKERIEKGLFAGEKGKK